ncbi:MAG: arylesterase [Opitutaceae bacterium]|jgi:acyl-CoA thioesterase-1
METRVIERATATWAARALLSLLLGWAPVRLRSEGSPAEHTIVFFGDSLTAGYGLADPGSQSYPAQVQGKIDAEHLPWRVVNAGVSGETSAGGLRRVDWVLRQRLDVFVLELGANDGLRGTPTEVTRANLQEIIDRVRTRYPAAKIVLAGMRMPQNMGPDYATAFRAIYPALAQKNAITLIPFLLDGVAARPELNQPDGIHPTASGAAIIADEVWKLIAPIVRDGR